MFSLEHMVELIDSQTQCGSFFGCPLEAAVRVAGLPHTNPKQDLTFVNVNVNGIKIPTASKIRDLKTLIILIVWPLLILFV